MSLLARSLGIFVTILFLLLVVAIYSYPAMIGIVMLLIAGLVIWQVILVLKDEG
ncbi:MAG: hypothetical protein MRY78_19020 [Saprospiraceae bacterium]|nr:hypothetical protein [Saprospiraceae bacterium]